MKCPRVGMLANTAIAPPHGCKRPKRSPLDPSGMPVWPLPKATSDWLSFWKPSKGHRSLSRPIHHRDLSSYPRRADPRQRATPWAEHRPHRLPSHPGDLRKWHSEDAAVAPVCCILWPLGTAAPHSPGQIGLRHEIGRGVLGHAVNRRAEHGVPIVVVVRRFERASEADAITRSNMRMRAANLAAAGVHRRRAPVGRCMASARLLRGTHRGRLGAGRRGLNRGWLRRLSLIGWWRAPDGDDPWAGQRDGGRLLARRPIGRGISVVQLGLRESRR